MTTLPAGWKPIESAPKNQLVMVYTPPQPSDWPDSVRIGFDYIDTEVADDYWYNHGEHYEHYCCVAKPENCTGPQERAPYTHWMPLPTAPGSPPASAQPERDWELTCDGCDGDGFVYVERRVGPCATDIQTFKEECECCEGRGFVFAFEDIPGIEEYVKSRRAAPAAGDARDAERLDWLEQHDGRFFNKDRISSIVGVGFLVAGDPEGVRHQTVRSAIDAAIAAQQGKGGNDA